MSDIDITYHGLTFEQFQDEALPVKPFDYDELGPMGTTLYWSNGVGGEAGEFQNAVKKVVRDGITSEGMKNMVEEAGDTLFYLKMTLERYGYTLEDAATYCMVKLDRLRQEQDD
jgi:phosphoribosyl-ATP pyrophosphohydrolase